jgi:hypothetical protein
VKGQQYASADPRAPKKEAVTPLAGSPSLELEQLSVKTNDTD